MPQGAVIVPPPLLSLHTFESVWKTVHKLQTFAALQCKRHSSFHFHTVAKLRPQAMNNPRRNKFPQVTIVDAVPREDILRIAEPVAVPQKRGVL